MGDAWRPPSEPPDTHRHVLVWTSPLDTQWGGSFMRVASYSAGAWRVGGALYVNYCRDLWGDYITHWRDIEPPEVDHD
jgi:hypothetical protein